MIYEAVGRLLDCAMTWRQRRLEAEAWPTLKALCDNVPCGYKRDIDRLWMDGGNHKGFRACVKLGWADITRADISASRATFWGEATAAGRKRWANQQLGVKNAHS